MLTTHRQEGDLLPGDAGQHAYHRRVFIPQEVAHLAQSIGIQALSGSGKHMQALHRFSRRQELLGLS